jgi:hypothetical protein
MDAPSAFPSVGKYDAVTRAEGNSQAEPSHLPRALSSPQRAHCTQLWLVLIASFSAVAIILMGLQLLDNDGAMDDRELEILSDDERAAKLRLAADTRWSFMRSLFHSHYHTFAAYLQGDDYEWVTGPERLLRLGLLFLVLSAFLSLPPTCRVEALCGRVVSALW